MKYQPLENYGVIGDLNTIALVGMNGSIDYLCFPDFDSPSVFAGLLDREKGGHFRIAPVREEVRHRQMYLPDTNILITRFLFQDGVAEISDFMPVREACGVEGQLIRRVKCIRGAIEFRLELAPRFDYARKPHRLEREGNAWIFRSEDLALRLHSDVEIENRGEDGYANFTLKTGETASFCLELATPGESAATQEHYQVEAFKKTMNYWRNWIRRSTYRGRWREMVNRSALALKLLVSKKHGSIVAAPTFSLPEEIGGERNWDYRYTWIRDASFTLYALMRLGYTEEAGAFMKWIEQRCDELGPDGQLQIMYGLDGSVQLTESTLDHLEGYKGSSPVRIGNAAHDQLQLDIYGELMDSVYLYNKYGAEISYDFWMNLTRLIDWVCENWREPDDSIWEMRSTRKQYCFSRFMCWVAVDRGVRLAMKRSFPAPLERWRRVRDEIYQSVYEDFWNPELKTFVQSKGSQKVDAACLLMPLVKFIGPTDPRWLSTMEAIERNLVVDSMVYRYNICEDETDGLSGNEGTFSMCSFWRAEAISRSGDLNRARLQFEKTLGYANHLGLFAEELGPQGEHLGNFPQAFTHLALISAAYNLNDKLNAAHS